MYGGVSVDHLTLPLEKDVIVEKQNKKTNKLTRVKMNMQDIWMATRPNVYSNKKKYGKKDRREARINPSGNGY